MSIELEPFFQPIIDVNSGLIAYNEALARRKSTTKGHYVSAGAIFSSDAFTKKQIIEFDTQVRHKALTKYKNYTGNAKLTINISPDWFNNDIQESNKKIPTLSMIEECGIDPSKIVIELTEYNGDKHLIEHFVRAYRNMGVKIAIDDFGSGFSQIDRLIEIEPDIIKLDMNIFRRSLVSSYTKDLIDVISSFAKKRGTELIFEGIETTEQYKIAVDSGADFVQGYLFSQAQPEFYPDDHFLNDVNTLKYSK